MKPSPVSLFAGLLLAAASLATTPALADDTVKCNSSGYRHSTCRLDKPGRVTLQRQTSNTRCVQGRNWDYDARAIWVDDGCQAEFIVGTGWGNGYQPMPPSAFIPPSTIRCESTGGRVTRDVARPEVRPHDLLVRNASIGVNRADVSHRKGAYGRAHFGESDLMGLELMARAGYDPRHATSIWKKMQRLTEGKQGPSFLRTHPTHDTRIAELEAYVPKVLPLYEDAITPTSAILRR